MVKEMNNMLGKIIIDNSQHIHSELGELETLRKAKLASHVFVNSIEQKVLIDIHSTNHDFHCHCPQSLLSRTYQVILYISLD